GHAPANASLEGLRVVEPVPEHVVEARERHEGPDRRAEDVVDLRESAAELERRPHARGITVARPQVLELDRQPLVEEAEVEVWPEASDAAAGPGEPCGRRLVE